jgi:UPF0755 protein
MKKRLGLFLLIGVLLVVGTALAMVGGAWWWAHSALTMNSDKIDFIVDPGASPRRMARELNQAGVQISEEGFVWLARLSQRDKLIKAGGYEISRGDTPWSVVQRLARGDMTQRQITFVEGWNYRQIRQLLAENPDVKQTLTGVDDADLLKRLGSDASSMEGLLFPDTYIFAPGTTDFDLLRRAYDENRKITQEIWAGRSPNLPLSSLYDMSILASIIEKETGLSSDRARVAGVFVNRLRAGMPLQTDPTVIYGMGVSYQGRIHKRDLQVDTPWNTYTRPGLPPTPIASPGRAALMAAAHPEAHAFLYFVSRGNGSSEFSTTLNDHNRSVSRFILEKGK